MDFFSIWHWLIVLIIVLILFGGRGKVSAVMGDLGKGLKAFKKSMQEEESADAKADAPKAIESAPAPVIEPATTEGRQDRDEDKMVEVSSAPARVVEPATAGGRQDREKETS